MSNERDPELERLYREQSREEPSSALDAKILAAAHRAVASAPRKPGEATRPQRWWMPLAAAAAIGIVAIGVIQQMPKEGAIDATSVPTAPSSTPAPATSPVPAAPPPAAPAAAPPPAAQAPAATMEQRSVPATTGALAKKQKEADAATSPPPPPPPAVAAAKPSAPSPAQPARDSKLVAEPAPVPFPAAPAPQKTEAATSGEAKRDMPAEQPMADARKDAFREERQNAAPASAGAPPPPPPAAAPVARMRAQSEMAAGAIAQSKNADDEMRTLARDPDAWITRIRKLRDEGNTAQALRELKEFRALVPEAERRLPPDLRSLQP